MDIPIDDDMKEIVIDYCNKKWPTTKETDITVITSMYEVLKSPQPFIFY